jgi:23S rRNA (cytosine1962-C5)-methyltransferase
MLDPRGAERLLAGDADYLPGLVVDRYADCLVVQSGCQGSDAMRDFLLELLEAELQKRGLAVRAILDRSDAAVRKHEQLERRVEWLRGSEADALVLVEEDGLAFEVDLLGGHKTGFYLDQRENRKRAAALCADYARHGFDRVAEPRVLDVFSYDGLFGLRCALAGAGEVLCLDQAAAAGERLAQHAERAGLAGRVRFERVDAMADLGQRVKAGESWDVVILDPPAFARSRREIEGAKRGYGELFRRGFQLVGRGGFVVAASCSFNMGWEDFRAVLQKSARDAGVSATLLGIDGPSADHPRRVGLPESDYLKCAFLRVDPAS